MPEEYINKTKNFLEKIDFESITQKCKTLYLLMQTIKGIKAGKHKKKLPKKLAEFEFLRELDREELFEVFYLVKDAHDSQENVVKDMIATFDRWHADIDDKELGRISYPNECEFLIKEAGDRHEWSYMTYFLKSPGIDKWIDDNTNGNIVCNSILKMDYMDEGEEVKAALFAIASIYYHMEKPNEMVRIIQAATYETKNGKKSLPLKKPGLLALYLIFKEAERRDVNHIEIKLSLEIAEEIQDGGTTWFYDMPEKEYRAKYLSKSMKELYLSIIALDKKFNKKNRSVKFEM